MRCTNDIKERIRREVKETVREINSKYEKEIIKERSRLNIWRDIKIAELQVAVTPIIESWAKQMKKNFSSYIWEDTDSSAVLTKSFLSKMFYESSWGDKRFPKVTSKKLEDLIKKRDSFENKTESILADTFIKVSFIKSLVELNDLIEQTRISINSLYAD